MSDVKAKIKLGIAAVALLILAGLVVVFFQFKGLQDRQAIALPDLATDALLSLINVHQTATQDGQLQWELDAESAQLEEGTQRLRLQSPKIVFYSKEGGRIELTAAKGILNTQNKDLEVDGAVRVDHPRYTMWTEKLAYHHAERMLESVGAIKIIGKTMQLQANAMTYHIDTQQALFNGQVEGEILDGPRI